MFFNTLISLSFCALLVSALPDGIFLYETFSQDQISFGSWVKSSDSKYENQPIAVRPAKTMVGKGFESDNALYLEKGNFHYGISTKFVKPISLLPDKELVIQYELKLEESLNCGGAYIKLLRGSDSFDLKELTNDTPYSIMFGPDKCGPSNKVHLIFQYLNPITGQWEEKHSNESALVKNDKKTHLYTLVLGKTGDEDWFRVLIDKKEVKSGSLRTHFVPPFIPPPLIPDPSDSKPFDWDDRETLPDPEDRKPDDWDEDEPLMIPDPARLAPPPTWAPSMPLEIPDPISPKPEEWDDEEDGEWEAPTIPNPLCGDERVEGGVAGCGPYSPPSIRNPKFKGKWSPRTIPNPLYKGLPTTTPMTGNLSNAFIGSWAPREIPNPNSYSLPHLPSHPFSSVAGNLAPLTALSVEVWTTSGGIGFDNFIIGEGLERVSRLDGWETKSQAEDIAEKSEEKERRRQARKTLREEGDLKGWLEGWIGEGIELMQDSPGGLIGAGVAIGLGFLILIYFGLKSPTIRKFPPQRNASSNDQEPKKEVTKE